MPVYPKLKETQTETRFIITTDTNTYLFVKHDASDNVLLYIGGETDYCIECQVFKDINKPIGDLPHVYYDVKCSLTSKFERGTDTKNMLYIMFSYIRDNYPHVKGLTLQDMSYRECDNKMTIDLASFYYLMYGETWYTKMFGAKFMYDKDRIKFEEASAKFMELKKTLTWEEYEKYVLWEHPFDNIKMKEIYDKHTSWISYFMELRDMIGVSELCIYMHHWITTFINRVMRFRFTSPTYSIMLDNPKNLYVKYKIEPYSKVKGGRRHTRRMYKRRKAIAIY
jgi:hypothetical protein